jgi:hypothetical protein
MEQNCHHGVVQYSFRRDLKNSYSLLFSDHAYLLLDGGTAEKIKSKHVELIP